MTAPTLSNEASVSGLVTDPNEANNTINENTAVVTSADLRISMQDDRETTPILAGDLLTYTINVTNDGASNAQNVQLDDVLPSELTEAKYCQGTSCGGFSSNWTGALDLDTVTVGQTKVVRIQAKVRSNTDAGTVIHNVASLTSDTPDPDASDNSDAEDTSVETEANLDIFKFAIGQRRVNSPTNPNSYNPPVVAGDYMIYGLRINNWGPSDARDVVVTDDLPTQLEEENARYCFGQGCQNWNTPWTGTLDLDTVVPGESIVVRIRAKVPPNVVNNTLINNLGSVTSSTPDSNQTLNTFAINTRIITRADLDVTKTATPSPNVVAGERITYSLTLLNDGPSDAQNVVLTDNLNPLPNPPRFDDARFCVGQGCVVNGFSPAWTGSTPLGMVPTGEARYVTINARVLPSVLEGTNLHNTATPGSSTIDPIPSNNAGETDTNVHARADLSITKVDGPTVDVAGPDPVLAGQDLMYKLTVTNAGPSDAQNVRIEDALPNALENARYCLGAACTVDEASPTWPFPLDIGTIAAGASQVVKVKARVRSNTPDGPISNLAAVLSDTIDPNIHDANYDQEDTQVITRANVDIHKFGTPRPERYADETLIDEQGDVIAGDQILYVIRVNNWGPSDARNVQVNDVLPTQLQNARYCTFVDDDVNLPCENFDQPWPSSNVIDLGTLGPQPPSHSTIIRVLADIPANVPRGTVLRNPPAATNPPPGTFARVTTSTTDPIPSPQPGHGDAGGTTFARDTVDTRAELEITKTGRPDPVTAGSETDPTGPLTYDVTVTNHGPSDAQLVQVTDTLSPQLVRADSRYDDPSYCILDVNDACPTGYSTLPVSGVVDVGTLSDGDDRIVRIKATVHPSTPDCVVVNAGDCVHNEVTVTSSTVDPGTLPFPNTATTDTGVVTEADVGVVKEVDSGVVAGTDVIYKLTVKNDGPSDAQNVQLTDDLPNLLNEANASYCFGEDCTPDTPWTGQLDLGTMDALETIVVRIRAPLPADVTEDTQLCNAAAVATDTVDNGEANDATGDVCVPTDTEVDLQLTKDNSVTLVGQGTNVDYGIRITNHGPSVAQGVNVDDPVPSKTVFAGGDGTHGGDNVVRWGPFTLAPGESRDLSLTLRPTTAAGDPFGRFGGPIENEANVTSTTAETDPGDNTDRGQALKVCTVLGSDGNDSINGASGNDWLCGRGGDDTINGGAGSDVIQGDDGNDTLENAASQDSFDIVEGGNGSDTVWGGRGADRISGAFSPPETAGSDPYVDKITYVDEPQKTPADPVHGVSLSLADNVANAASGQDTLAAAGPSDNTFENVDGTNFADELTGDAQQNRVEGINCTSATCDTDYYTVHAPGQREQGGDVIHGREGDDNLIGSPKDDAIRGGIGMDTIQGMDGRDLVSGGLSEQDPAGSADTSNDSINGGPGGSNDQDIVWYLSSPRVEVDLSIGRATGEGTDSLGGIENVQGSPHSDLLIGSGGTNSIDGGGGDDTIHGGAASDSSAVWSIPVDETAYPGLNGGPGNDFVTGSTGNDYVGGGDGNDILHGNENDDTVSGGPDNDSAIGGIGNDLVTGGTGADSLEGNDGNDTLSGAEQNDTGSGGEGNDIINGGPGVDTLHGNAGNDSIGGDQGNDTLNGNTGDDQLLGEEGDDRLFGNENIDRLIGGANNDYQNGGAPNNPPPAAGDRCQIDSADTPAATKRVNCEYGL